jgi:hypothetical protein
MVVTPNAAESAGRTMSSEAWIEDRIQMRRPMNGDVTAAHKHCGAHRGELEASESCGCFYCLAIFSPQDIEEWVDEDSTALCPKCGIDSVIGAASGFPIVRGFLEQMHRRWFS